MVPFKKSGFSSCTPIPRVSTSQVDDFRQPPQPRVSSPPSQMSSSPPQKSPSRPPVPAITSATVIHSFLSIKWSFSISKTLNSGYISDENQPYGGAREGANRVYENGQPGYTTGAGANDYHSDSLWPSNDSPV